MLLELPYDRQRAVEYAQKWALDRNPLFLDFTGKGGDCTNFVSQCIFAGCGVMNYTPTFGWYFISSDDRAPAWTGVDELYSSVWGEIPLPSSSNTVTVHILNLRRKLEENPSSPKIIRTVWGKGYQID